MGKPGQATLGQGLECNGHNQGHKNNHAQKKEKAFGFRKAKAIVGQGQPAVGFYDFGIPQHGH